MSSRTRVGRNRRRAQDELRHASHLDLCICNVNSFARHRKLGSWPNCFATLHCKQPGEGAAGSKVAWPPLAGGFLPPSRRCAWQGQPRASQTPFRRRTSPLRPVRRFLRCSWIRPDLQLRVLRTRRHVAAGSQLAKIDLALGKLGLQPGMTLPCSMSDVGWGARLCVRSNATTSTSSASRSAATKPPMCSGVFDESDSPAQAGAAGRLEEGSTRAGGSHRLYRRVRTFRPRPL